MEVIECTKGHYEVQENQFGTVYRWCPERVVVECYCGQRTTLTRLESVCPKCGADHAATVQQELLPAIRRATKPCTPGITASYAKKEATLLTLLRLTDRPALVPAAHAYEKPSWGGDESPYGKALSLCIGVFKQFLSASRWTEAKATPLARWAQPLPGNGPLPLEGLSY